MEIVKREFIYRENTKLGPVEFKAFINRHVRKLRAREDVCKVSGNITDDYSKCVVKYTMIMPDPEPISEEDIEEVKIIKDTMEEVCKQLG